MAINDGISSPYPDELFGVPLPRPEHPETLAGIVADETNTPVIARPVVSVLNMSSQLPLPVARVESGDTSSMSDDIAAHTSPISPGPQDAYSSTGAGRGSTVMRHPNSTAGR